MVKGSLIKLLVCFVFVIATVGMAAANESDLAAPMSADGEAVSSAGTGGAPSLVLADEVKSANIKEADGTTGQNTNTGSGIKTNHIQNAAVTGAKIKAGAVTDAKITGPITASKIGFTGLNADKVDGKHAASFVSITGDTMTGALTATSFTGSGAGLTNVNHNKTACPDYLTKIEFANSTLCIARDNVAASWNQAQDNCNVYFAGASLCTHQQVRRACKNGGLALTADTWLADRIKDNYVFYVNSTDCDDFDGNSYVPTDVKSGAYCCLEWMKY